MKELEEMNMLVSATEMLQKAKAGHYAVGQFNINNLEQLRSLTLRLFLEYQRVQEST